MYSIVIYMNKYYIGSQGFKTKKETEEYTRKIVNELKTSRITRTDKYFSFFNDLIKIILIVMRKLVAALIIFYSN